MPDHWNGSLQDRLSGPPVASFASAVFRAAVVCIICASGVWAADGEVVRSAPAVVGARSSEFTAGKAYYDDGEFKKAAAQFRKAIAGNPQDAESFYWAGMAYQKLADIAIPFDARYRSRARTFLARAASLAPGRSDYRLDLFESLVDAGSAASFRQATGILRTFSESDPDSEYLRRRLEDEKRARSQFAARLGGLLVAGPRAVCQFADLPLQEFGAR